MKRGPILLAGLMAVALLAPSVRGGIDLVTLPKRDRVQLTIYNSADLTLVREARKLTLQNGLNELSFSWANTLIDPTSLHLRAVERPDAVQLLDVSYPPRQKNKAVWAVDSELEGEVPVEITFFTSGIHWRLFYMATLSRDEDRMRLQGYVRVTNESGEDYADAVTRLVVGKIHILDRIAELAQRADPYGRPAEARPGAVAKEAALRRRGEMFERAAGALRDKAERPKEITKEALAEYFLYTIQGTETIPHQWSKRLPSFEADEVPVVNLYKYDENRWGGNVVRFLYFKNDEAHNLGETPLPGGLIKVYRAVDQEKHLSYEGADNTKYIPVDQKVELNLGPARRVEVEPKLMAERTSNYMFNGNGDISGYDQTRTWRIEVKNRREMPIRVEIIRHLKHQYWEIEREGDFGDYEKEDVSSIKFTLELEGHSTKTFTYTVTYHEGERREIR